MQNYIKLFIIFAIITAMGYWSIGAPDAEF